MLSLSVIICTYNRANYLERVLNSILKQNYDYGDYELIIIDNGSKDHTQKVIQEYKGEFKYFNSRFEPILGVARARNIGANISSSYYIVFMDDDLLLRDNCLNELIKPFLINNINTKIVTGKCELDWEQQRPYWWPTVYEHLLSKYDFGEKFRKLGKDDYLVTMNVAFEKETFLKIGGLREDLSRKGKMFICGADNEIFDRYIGNKKNIYYNPKAIVDHFVPISRQSSLWLKKRVFGQGTTIAIMNYNQASKFVIIKSLLSNIRTLFIMILEKMQNRNKIKILNLIQQLGLLFALIQLILGVNNIRTTSE